MADYTFNDFTYKEPGVRKMHGRLAGVRGEFGLNLFAGLGVSVGGEYADGHLNFTELTPGASARTRLTHDYFRQTQGLIHFVYGSMVVAAGMAERYWYNHLEDSNRRRTRYNYTPIFFTYRAGPIYLKLEHDIWNKGWHKSHMSDVNPVATDIEFKLGKGTGSGAELGYRIAGMVTSRIFISYHKWDVKDSDVQSDGTQNYIESKNSVTEIKGGIGLAF